MRRRMAVIALALVAVMGLGPAAAACGFLVSANGAVNLLKTTTLAYAIAVPEMMYTANQIWSDNVNVPEMMVVLFVYYISLVGVLVWMMHRWEQRMRIPGYG